MKAIAQSGSPEWIAGYESSGGKAGRNFDIEDVAIEKANDILQKNSLVDKGDVVIYTAGAPHTDKSRTNWMRFVEI